MNSVADFLKSPWGIGALVVCALMGVVFLFGSCSSNQPRGIPVFTNTNALTRVSRDVGSIPEPVAPRPLATSNAPRRSVILSLSGPSGPGTNWVPRVFAPAGTFIRCVLVNAIESIRIDTPVVGLVIKDLEFQGQVVVPSGTRVLGKARVDRVRDRIAVDGNWTLVFPTGEELIVHGQALHCDESPDGQHWGPDDGIAGLKGRVIRDSSHDEIKLFAAKFLSGFSQGLQETESTIIGSRVRNTARNAALNGSAAVLDEYARSIAETIKRDGLFAFVPGGAPFYLYLPETLDRSAARIGATRSPSSHQ